MTINVPWKPLAWGVGVTVILGVLLVGGSRLDSPLSGRRDDSYAAQVAVSGAHVSRAEFLKTGDVVYWDATLENNGERTLTAYTAQLDFADPFGKPVGSEVRTLLDAHLRPLPPHSRRDVEIGFDDISPDWNQAPPRLSSRAVYVR